MEGIFFWWSVYSSNLHRNMHGVWVLLGLGLDIVQGCQEGLGLVGVPGAGLQGGGLAHRVVVAHRHSRRGQRHPGVA